jgi:hypothetical protein
MNRIPGTTTEPPDFSEPYGEGLWHATEPTVRPKTTKPLLPEPVLIIAACLDHPSVYMGGPSAASVRKAERIVDTLEAFGFALRKQP